MSKQVITMRDEAKPFMRTLCTVSATMASLRFVGVGIIITIFYQTKETAWRWVAYSGGVAVFSLLQRLFLPLCILDQEDQKERENAFGER